MVFRTRVIVRRVTKNRMVTKGYRKGVYDRVMSGTTADEGNYAPVNGGRGSGRSENKTRVQRDDGLTQSLHRPLSPTNIDWGTRPRNTWKCASSLPSSVLSMRNATKIRVPPKTAPLPSRITKPSSLLSQSTSAGFFRNQCARS